MPAVSRGSPSEARRRTRTNDARPRPLQSGVDPRPRSAGSVPVHCGQPKCCAVEVLDLNGYPAVNGRPCSESAQSAARSRSLREVVLIRTRRPRHLMRIAGVGSCTPPCGVCRLGAASSMAVRVAASRPLTRAGLDTWCSRMRFGTRSSVCRRPALRPAQAEARREDLGVRWTRTPFSPLVNGSGAIVLAGCSEIGGTSPRPAHPRRAEHARGSHC